MYAKTSLLLVVSMAVLAFGLSACGGSSQSASSAQSAPTPETQTTAHTSHNPSTLALVRKTESNIVTALESDHPEAACRFYVTAKTDECLNAVVLAKGMNIKPSSVYPINWRTLLAKANITIHGDTAVMDAIRSDKKNMTFVNVEGTWLRSS